MSAANEFIEIPADLRSAPPRIVQDRPRARWQRIASRIVPTIGILCSLIILGENALLRFTPPTIGRVARLNESNEGEGGISRHVGYEYTLNGRRWSDSCEVGARAYANYQIGQPVHLHAIAIGGLHYSLLDRSPWDYWFARAFLWLSAILIFAAGAAVTWHRNTSRRLLRDGSVVVGVITGKKKYKVESTTYRVGYSFADEFGINQSGSMNVNAGAYQSAAEGQKVAVIYDRAKPKRSVIYQFCGYRVE